MIAIDNSLFRTNNNLQKLFSLFLDLVFVAICFMPNSAIAQTPTLKEFNISDGLPSSHIYQTIQDKYGFIWVASDKGVSKYNGYSFENFTVKEGLPSNDVWGLHEDKSGRIWLSTFNELVYIENNKVSIISVDSLNLKGVFVNHVINNEKHLVKFSNPSKYIYQINDDLSVSSPLRIQSYSQKLNHLFLFDLEDNPGKKNDVLVSEWQFTDQDNVLKRFLTSDITTHFKNVLVTEAQVIFMLQDSILRFKNGIMQSVTNDIDDLNNLKIFAIYNSNQYLVSSKDYTYWLDENFQVIPDLLLEANLNINNASLDRENNLWLSTSDGLLLIRRRAFKSKSYIEIDNNRLELYSIEKDGADRIWMGGNNSTLYLFDSEGQHKQYILSDDLKRPITGIDFDHNNGMLLSGSHNYYLPIKKNTANSTELTANLQSLSEENPQGNAAIVNTRCVLLNDDSFIICHGNHIAEMTPINDKLRYLSSNRIKKTYALAINSANELCYGQAGGIFIENEDGTFKTKFDHPLFNVPINDLKYDDDDYLWIATQGQGLFRYKENRLDTIYELLDQDVNNIRIYNKVDVWVSNSKGVHKIKTAPNQSFQYVHKNYNRSHGLVSNEVHDYIVSEDHIYVSTKKGLSVLPVDSENDQIDNNCLIFSGITINDKDTLLLEKYILNHNENNIRIDFVWLSFLEDQNMTYSYILEGEDDTWESTKNIYKEYTNLAPGKYRFKIVVTNNSQKILSKEKSISFVIQKPWWLSNIAIAIFSILLILILYSIYSLLIWRAKNQAEMKNQLNKKFAELELNALQAQMNPHFIFNALNSIQDFIFSKDNRTANKYLVKFSKLMRLFLESSKEKIILFSEELKLLQLYVELEELRFEDKFTSRFIVDRDINKNNIKIPSMIIQPFLENSINHGLKYKENGGQLKITFQKKDDAVFCVIEDNGIGREMSRKLNLQNKKSYKSRGIHIVNERKNIFNLMQQTNIEIKYFDLKDKANNALGTKVEILMPFLA